MNERDVIRFWDDFVTGRAAPGSTSLDATASASIRAFQAAAAIPPPETSRQQVTREVRAAIEKLGQERPRQVATADVRVDGRSRLNGLPADPGPRVQPANRMGLAARRRWPVIPLIAAAALLLVGLGIGYVVFGSGFSGDESRTTIPAAVEPAATPSPAPFTEESLLEITIPAAALPQGEGIAAGLAIFTIPPGNRSTWLPYCCDGPLIEYVISGTYTVRAQDPIEVVRSDGMVEEIPAGAEATLEPGDSLLSRNETLVEDANTGDSPVELLSWVVIEQGNSFNGHQLPGWASGAPDAQFQIDLSPAPATLRIKRIEMIGEAIVSAPADGGMLWFAVPAPVNAAGTPTSERIAKLSNGELINASKETNVAYLLTFEQVASAAGSPIAGSPTP
jgi:hypothetical protein